MSFSNINILIINELSYFKITYFIENQQFTLLFSEVLLSGHFNKATSVSRAVNIYHAQYQRVRLGVPIAISSPAVTGIMLPL